MAAPAPARPPGGSTELIIGFRDGVSQAEQARVLSSAKVRKRVKNRRRMSTIAPG